ncbi:hypothetical protein [Halosolutus halophilus]|uniref:hypothetical protein n=1 Tax=Halosolutus halophilus TaxID=1552990 RepID=UPI0022352F91|nr:hypothetical protein [Halosolutus halophilus]
MSPGDDRRCVHAALQRALADVQLPSEDYTAIRTWVNEELPQLQAAGYTAYVVFGSYRGSYHRSLRISQYELAKPTTATAVVLGDTPPLGLTIGRGRTDPLEFEIKFHLLTEFADRNVAIYEKDSGGEAVELGLLRHDHCFRRTVVLPRDYYGLGRRRFETKDDVFEIARHVAFADDLDDGQRKAELRGLIATARDDGIDVTEHELTAFLEDELASRDDEPSYSWVHLALFRRFEEDGRCRTWHTEPDLRAAVDDVALGASPRWELEADDLD